jgi:lantibiotic modifying enzyme
MALAVTFSLTDMHTGNVIAHRYKPYLIDLETSFTKRVEKIQDTEINRPFMESKCSGSSPHCLRMNRQVIVVDLFGREVSSSFVEMLQLLQSLKESKPFFSWCQRFGKVITRVVPFATDFLQKILESVYKEQTIPSERLLDQQLKDAIEEEFPFQELRSSFDQKVFTEPRHLLTIHKQFSEDFKNLDIPVFYHRIGSLYLMNSKGQRVEVDGLQDKREYFDKDPFEVIKEQQIYNLGQERITKLTENLLEFWANDEFSDEAKSALLGLIKKAS